VSEVSARGNFALIENLRIADQLSYFKKFAATVNRDISASQARFWILEAGLEKWCRLAIYMAAADTTTIRVPVETRDRLNSLAARRGEPAGEVVAKLVSAADEDAMLDEVAVGFERIASDPQTLAVYRTESEAIESGFEAPAPEW
jgi:hypothetical protein